jgi:hypothetical protein
MKYGPLDNLFIEPGGADLLIRVDADDLCA